MSPRNPPASLQGPGTPTLAHTHALPNPVHTPHPPPALSHGSNSIGGLTSPPPTPSSASIPRLNATSNTFVPRQKKITLKNEDGTEVNLDNIAKSAPAPVAPAVTAAPQGSVYRQGSPGTPTRRPASVRIESEDQRKARLAEEEAKEKERARVKAEAEEKVRKEKEAAERKLQEEEERKLAQEEAEKERVRKEEEAKLEAERARIAEEERVRKEKEELAAQKIREEEDRKRKEEEEAQVKLLVEKAKKEEEERLEQQRLDKAKAEKERLAQEAEAERLRLEQEEATRKAAEAVPEPAAPAESSKEASEDGEVVEGGQDVEATASSKEEPKDKIKDALRINTSPLSDRRQRPGPLDLTGAKIVPVVGTPTPGPLATARIIVDINTVQYPEGVSSPRPDLNEHAKEGKFR